MTTKFIDDLINKLKTKPKPLTESSIEKYIETLCRLNDNEPIYNLTFLKDTNAINEKLKNYSDNSKKTVISTLVSILQLYNSRSYKDALRYYKESMNLLSKQKKDFDATMEKTPKQHENWMTWEQVQKLFKDKQDKIKFIINKRKLDEKQYNELLEYLVLSLYVAGDTKPRRNKELQTMYIVEKYNPDVDSSELNWLDLATNTMIINNQKSKEKEFENQHIKISSELMKIIKQYLKHYPVQRESGNAYPLLVDFNNNKLDKINSITNILNKVFNKKISSSMLRHIYDSSKFSNVIKELKTTAHDMGHTLNTAISSYIKI